MKKRLLFIAVCLITLFAGPNMFAIIWGPVGVPPLGTERDVMFYSCSGCSYPSYTGDEYWNCLRNLYHSGSPAEYATVSDVDCETSEDISYTYWCKDANGNWHQITATQFEKCETCPTN